MRSKIPQVKHRQTIDYTFNIIFFFTSTSFLILYHNYFIYPELSREMGKWYPKRKSLLFTQPCDMVKFKIVTFILSSFHIVASLLDLNLRDVSNAVSKLLHASLLMICYFYGYENFSIVLSINLGLLAMFTELLSLLALHSDKDQITMLRLFVGFKFASWMYIFLNFLPFQYLIPSLYAGDDSRLYLNLSFIVWYTSKIWTSPLLNIFCHQLYHLSDCPGENSLIRCLMLKDSPEFKHQANLKRAYLEVKLHHQRHQLNKLNLGESAASATAFNQTIKCVMTLKRKLKRIRESHKTSK